VTLSLAAILGPAAILLAPRTRRPGWRRRAFVLVVLALDGALLAEVVGPAGPRTLAAVIILAPALLLPFVGFVYWWRAVDRDDAFRRYPPEAAAYWLLEQSGADAPTDGGSGSGPRAADGHPMGVDPA
jgi:hypothetical protein